MNKLRRWDSGFIVGKVIMMLLFAVLVGATGVEPANAKDGNNHGNNNGNGRYENRGRGYEHGHNMHNRRVYRSYGYRERVYVPPPVYFAPPPPPGIGLFFPTITIRP